MVKFTTEQLKKEAQTIKHIEKRFVSILSKSIEDANSISRALRELDPLMFSQDHNWRDVINGLNEASEKYHAYRRIALVKYMQYLSSRQEIIKYLYSEKRKMLQEPEEKAEETLESNNIYKETALLENTVFEPPGEGDDSAGQAFERMPKGEALSITLAPGTEVEMRLSKYICKIVIEDEKITFMDEAGEQYDLSKGRSTIGRDLGNTVMLGPSLRDISRLHLLIENLDNRTLRLTDMSSHGTFIPKQYIERHTGY